MGIAYIKVHKISGVKPSALARYELSATLISDSTIISPVLLTASEHSGKKYLKTDNIWSLPFERIMHDDGISLTLQKGKTKYKSICKLNLPLTWFQIDSVVREDFPMHNCNNSKAESNKSHNFQNDKVFIDVSVHISTRGVDPFEDPKGSLTVRPAWKKNSNQSPQQNHSRYPAQHQYAAPQHYQQQPGPVVQQPIQSIIQIQRVAPPPGIPQITAGPAMQIFSQPLYQTQTPYFPPNHQTIHSTQPPQIMRQTQQPPQQQQQPPQQPPQMMRQTQQTPHHMDYAPNQQFVVKAQRPTSQQQEGQQAVRTQQVQQGASLVEDVDLDDISADDRMAIDDGDVVHFQPVTMESANAANIRNLSETQVPLIPQ